MQDLFAQARDGILACPVGIEIDDVGKAVREGAQEAALLRGGRWRMGRGSFASPHGREVIVGAWLCGFCWARHFVFRVRLSRLAIHGRHGRLRAPPVEQTGAARLERFAEPSGLGLFALTFCEALALGFEHVLGHFVLLVLEMTPPEEAAQDGGILGILVDGLGYESVPIVQHVGEGDVRCVGRFPGAFDRGCELCLLGEALCIEQGAQVGVVGGDVAPSVHEAPMGRLHRGGHKAFEAVCESLCVQEVSVGCMELDGRRGRGQKSVASGDIGMRGVLWRGIEVAFRQG